MTDKRSTNAAEYRKLYKTAQWKKIREAQLAAEPLCVMCKQAGRITKATVCDHIENHKGDAVLFFTGPFQSLCKTHHDSAKQSEDRKGFSKAVGLDGWPTDPRHPANTGGGAVKISRPGPIRTGAQVSKS